MTPEIIIFGLIALFVGLRLFSVLGQRTGHEQQPMADKVEKTPERIIALPPVTGEESNADAPVEAAGPIAPAAVAGLRAIVSADSKFDTGQFLAGACSAYNEILEAFWKGDEAALEKMVGPDVFAAFTGAIQARATEGLVLDNRLVRIDSAVIEAAALEQSIARITIRFDADIAGVTRDKNDQIVAGSLSDAIPSHDIWTFSRNVRDSNPEWMLVETDQAA